MTGFLIRRLFLALGVVLGATVAIFLLVYAIPDHPVSAAAGVTRWACSVWWSAP